MGAETLVQFVDPEVSRLKFAEEVDLFMQGYAFQRQRGIIILERKFPDLFLAFSAVNVFPAPIVFAVKINFENYDLEPLSIRFINPFTFEPLKLLQMATYFKRNIGQGNQIVMQDLLQQEGAADSLPFLCIPGVREYHKHPAHTGDSWLLHRKVAGEGSLGFLIDKLYEYGVAAITGYNIQLNLSTPNAVLGIDLSKLPS